MVLPVLLFTDFGLSGPYIGQVKAALWNTVPTAPVIDLMADVPVYSIKAGAHLLAALLPYCPAECVVAAIVDPGVGSDRNPVVVELGGRCLVGPDNGLFNVACARSGGGVWHRIVWRPDHLSQSFHGRDLFAPVAGRLAAKAGMQAVGCSKITVAIAADEGLDCAEFIYFDHYGNGMTGLRGAEFEKGRAFLVDGREILHADTFSCVSAGTVFWYVNSLGLVEVAVNQGSAETALSLRLGDPIYELKG